MLTAAQVAQALGISVRAVYDLRQLGNLPAAAARPYRWTPEAVDAFRSSCRVDTPRAPARPGPAVSQAEMAAAINRIGRKR